MKYKVKYTRKEMIIFLENLLVSFRNLLTLQEQKRAKVRKCTILSRRLSRSVTFG